MTVSQNMAQLPPTGAESTAKSPANLQSNARQTGLFGSIFESLTETENPMVPGSARENQESRQDTKTNTDADDRSNVCLAALIPAGNEVSGYTATGKGDDLTGKSLIGMMNKTLNRLGHAVEEMTAGGDDSLPLSVIEDIRTAVGKMEHIANDMTFSDKPVSSKNEDPEKAGNTEKSLKQISEKLDVLMSLLNVAGNQVSPRMEPDSGKSDFSPITESGSGEKETLRQIVSSMQSVIEQCNNFVSQKQMIRSDSEGTSPVDKTSGAAIVPKVTQNGDGKLSSINTPGSIKPGELPTSLATPVDTKDSNQATNQGKNFSAGNNPNLSNVEVAFRDFSTTDGFTKGEGDIPGNNTENGKEKPNLTNVNMGAHLFETPTQSSSQAQNAVSEPSKPVSPEQIIAQVREKLAASRTNGDISQITLKLHPEDLGELKISMKMENQSLKVDIVTANQNVKEALMNNMDSLKETLSRQNISMDRFNVLTGSGYGSDDNQRQWRQTTQNFVPNTFRQLYGFTEEPLEKSIGYLDSPVNSLIDVRL